MYDQNQLALRELFTRYVTTHPLDGALGAVVDHLVTGSLTRGHFDAIVDEFGVADSRRFRDGLLDLVLCGIRAALRDHTPRTDEMAALHDLMVMLRIGEGEFYQRRRAEVAGILQQEVHRILADEVADLAEVCYQEALQRLFGLGYDQYVELTRDAVTPLVERAIVAVAADGIVTPEEHARLDRQLAALQTVYVLTPGSAGRWG